MLSPTPHAYAELSIVKYPFSFLTTPQSITVLRDDEYIERDKNKWYQSAYVSSEVTLLTSLI